MIVVTVVVTVAVVFGYGHVAGEKTERLRLM
jgi:hypothetical protein